MWADLSEVTKAKRGHRSYGGRPVRSNKSKKGSQVLIMWADLSEVTKAKRGHRSYGGGRVRSNNSDSLLCSGYSCVARVMEGNEVE